MELCLFASSREWKYKVDTAASATGTGPRRQTARTREQVTVLLLLIVAVDSRCGRRRCLLKFSVILETHKCHRSSGSDLRVQWGSSGRSYWGYMYIFPDFVDL